MKTNYRKQTILITIFLTMFSFQLLFAQEESEEIKTEDKNKIIHKEEPISIEENNNEGIAPTIDKNKDTLQKNDTKAIKKHTSKKKNKKKKQQNISTNQLSQTSDKNTLKEKEKENIFNFIFFAIGVYIIYRIVAYRYRRKCKHCGKWNAMRKNGTYCVGEKDSRIKETTNVRDGNGKVLRTYEEFVPATTYFYETHRKCKYCNFKDVLKSSETKKN